MSKKEKEIVLNPKTDYTPKQLREFLEKKYKTKESGKKFTNQDVYGYAKNGKIPEVYGNWNIEVLDFKGVKIYRISK